jgi:hypothetical protein
MKLVWLIKMRLTETYNIRKHLSHALSIHNGLKEDGALSQLLFSLALE